MTKSTGLSDQTYESKVAQTPGFQSSQQKIAQSRASARLHPASSTRNNPGSSVIDRSSLIAEATLLGEEEDRLKARRVMLIDLMRSDQARSDHFLHTPLHHPVSFFVLILQSYSFPKLFLNKNYRL